MKLIDCFYQAGVIDCWTFVFDEQSPPRGYYTMLAASESGRVFSQWTEGLYDPSPDGDNAHLGQRPRVIGETLVNHVFARTSDEAHAASAPPHREHTVIVGVLGSVAYVTSQPDRVDVVLIDHENEDHEHNEHRESEVK